MYRTYTLIFAHICLIISLGNIARSEISGPKEYAYFYDWIKGTTAIRLKAITLYTRRWSVRVAISNVEMEYGFQMVCFGLEGKWELHIHLGWNLASHKLWVL